MNKTKDGTNAEPSPMRAMRGEVPEQQEIPDGACQGMFLGDLERAVAQLEDQAVELRIALRDLELQLAEKTRL